MVSRVGKAGSRLDLNAALGSTSGTAGDLFTVKQQQLTGRKHRLQTGSPANIVEEQQQNVTGI